MHLGLLLPPAERSDTPPVFGSLFEAMGLPFPELLDPTVHLGLDR